MRIGLFLMGMRSSDITVNVAGLQRLHRSIGGRAGGERFAAGCENRGKPEREPAGD
jgi:hypothetical protein